MREIASEGFLESLNVGSDLGTATPLFKLCHGAMDQAHFGEACIRG